jgi:hypothetical protein
MPRSLASNEAVVIGATFSFCDSNDKYTLVSERKIAIVLTARKSTMVNSPFNVSVVDASKTKHVHAMKGHDEPTCALAVQLSPLCIPHHSSLSDIYNGDMFSADSRRSASLFNSVAQTLMTVYGLQEADLTEQFVAATSGQARHGKTRKAQRASEEQDTLHESKQNFIHYNDRKLYLPKGWKAMHNVRKGLALLKNEKDNRAIAFFDILANNEDFVSDEVWESYLEEQARILESIAMAYRIIAQMKPKTNKNKKENKHDYVPRRNPFIKNIRKDYYNY